MWLIVVFSLRISHPIGLVDNKISARIVAFCVAFLFVRDSASFFEKRNFVFRDAAVPGGRGVRFILVVSFILVFTRSYTLFFRSVILNGNKETSHWSDFVKSVSQNPRGNDKPAHRAHLVASIRFLWLFCCRLEVAVIVFVVVAIIVERLES